VSTENLVLRTVYVDEDVDDQLRAEALDEGISKADLFRRYLVSGIKAAKAKPDLLQAASRSATAPLVLRTVHMDPKLDERLRVEAFDSRTSKNDLLRRYVWISMGLKGSPLKSDLSPSANMPRTRRAASS